MHRTERSVRCFLVHPVLGPVTILIAVVLLILAERAVGADVTVERISVAAAGFESNHYSGNPDISADGRYVAFRSLADNLVPADTNAQLDVFFTDTATGFMIVASSDAAGVSGNGPSSRPSLSANGRYIAFYSFASNLVPHDTNNKSDVFRKDLQTGAIQCLSVAADGSQGYANSYDPSISADGRYVVFYSEADTLVPGDTNMSTDVFLSDTETGAITLVSTAMSGGFANGASAWPTISHDNRFVAFHSYASDMVPGDNPWRSDVFVKDLQTGVVSLVNVGDTGVKANGDSFWASISGDGRFVVFESNAANLVPVDANGHARDIFIKDIRGGGMELVSVNAEGAAGNGPSFFGSLSSDGRYVVFHSYASNLVPGDTNGKSDVFVKDRKTGDIMLVSSGASGAPGNGDSFFSALSGDGQRAVFQSGATNLVAGDTNGFHDVFLSETSNCKGRSKRCR